ncbi:hypothetical protein J6590_016978 [Homalodisca vitripennis]|nr:hypothetical protein J6590_016978 [Homalodisca vitripennis]
METSSQVFSVDHNIHSIYMVKTAELVTEPLIRLSEPPNSRRAVQWPLVERSNEHYLDISALSRKQDVYHCPLQHCQA